MSNASNTIKKPQDQTDLNDGKVIDNTSGNTAPPATTEAQDHQNFDAAWDDMDKNPPAAASDGGGGDADDRGDDEAAPAADVAPAATKQSAPAATPEDLWSGLTDKQKAALGDLNSRLSGAEQLAQRHIGQTSGMQRQINDLLAASKQSAPAGQAAPTAAQVQTAMQTTEGWDQLKQDYPSIAGPIEAAMKAQRELVLKEARDIVSQTTQPLMARAEQDEQDRQASFVREQVRLLNDAHPDWQEVKAAPEFKTWVGSQAPGVQAMIRSQNAADAMTLIALYKRDSVVDTVADLSQRRNKRLQQAASSPGSSGRAAVGRPAQIPDDFEAAWDALDRQSAASKK